MIISDNNLFKTGNGLHATTTGSRIKLKKEVVKEAAHSL